MNIPLTDPSSKPGDALTSKEMSLFSRLISDLTGIRMNDKQRGFLAYRLNYQVKALGFNGYHDYYLYLKAKGEFDMELHNFIDSVITPETSFFRTPRIWESLQNNFLISWHQAHENESCRMWSAACASGEEAYTISIVASEISRLIPGFGSKILATDISLGMLEKATKGIYHSRSMRLVDEEIKKKYFKKLDGETFEVNEILKDKINFTRQNLLKKPFFGEFDVVFLRNVLIYFDQETQLRVLGNILTSLKKGGLLIIGETESLSNLKLPVEYVQLSIYKRT